MEGASEDRLLAGCLYEYARESHKLRSWLVLRHTPKHKRFWLPALIGIEFERSADDHIHLSKSGWEMWLDNFVAELAADESFAEVFERDPSKVAKSLAALPSYDRYPKAVELPGRYINVPGMQEIMIQIDWRRYTNGKIGEEMKRFAALNRPQSEPEPRRTGKKRQSKVIADLKALSALRIWKLHEDEPWKRLELIAKICGYKGCKRELSEHKQRSKRGHADEPITAQAKTEMSDARTRALDLFRRLFPWGNPSNY
jgi:hypothetical protein